MGMGGGGSWLFCLLWLTRCDDLAVKYWFADLTVSCWLADLAGTWCCAGLVDTGWLAALAVGFVMFVVLFGCFVGNFLDWFPIDSCAVVSSELPFCMCSWLSYSCHIQSSPVTHAFWAWNCLLVFLRYFLFLWSVTPVSVITSYDLGATSLITLAFFHSFWYLSGSIRTVSPLFSLGRSLAFLL